ncbi:E3 ubiquitin-protein ligase TRIM21-like [Xiphophorus maculatus]|uniref:E3 ubiquitin-protein ligase TRIM21-like n=1 Tax=Xiphophorus maculatus TaxID=8083 RepID=M4A6R5_XIPMA|nr:E3 ubiquitin-protein ligase TRIM21-like [Xiphophorus maculatus]
MWIREVELQVTPELLSLSVCCSAVVQTVLFGSVNSGSGSPGRSNRVSAERRSRRAGMSTASCLLSEDQFRCFICQNVFTDPVSTPCGHNFCKTCVTENVCDDVPFQCPVCEKMFFPRPELEVNTLIAELLDEFRRSALRQNAEAEIPGPVSGHLFTKNRKIAILCGMVLLFILSSQVSRSPPLTEETEGKAKGIMEDIWTFSSAKRCQNLTSGQNRTAVGLLSAAQLEQIFTEVMKKETPRLLIRAELMRAKRYAVDVTLDPDTVHPKLILSDDGKQVSCCNPRGNLPHDPNRFLYFKFVLGEQSFSSGRFYFEVQVKGKTNWTIGVATESVSRTDRVRLIPRSGFWSLTVRNQNEFFGLSSPPVPLSLKSGLEKVGVFVDYEEGLVFFYDVDAAALIFSFTGCFFTERLHPLFGPGHNNDGTNGAPLIITPVSIGPQ